MLETITAVPALAGYCRVVGAYQGAAVLCGRDHQLAATGRYLALRATRRPVDRSEQKSRGRARKKYRVLTWLIDKGAV